MHVPRHRRCHKRQPKAPAARMRRRTAQHSAVRHWPTSRPVDRCLGTAWAVQKRRMPAQCVQHASSKDARGFGRFRPRPELQQRIDGHKDQRLCKLSPHAHQPSQSAPRVSLFEYELLHPARQSNHQVVTALPSAILRGQHVQLGGPPACPLSRHRPPECGRAPRVRHSHRDRDRYAGQRHDRGRPRGEWPARTSAKLAT